MSEVRQCYRKREEKREKGERGARGEKGKRREIEIKKMSVERQR